MRSTRVNKRIDDAHDQTRNVSLHALQLLRASLRESIRDSREQPDGTIRELLVPLAILLHLLRGISRICMGRRWTCGP
jgi:hypothetical protein